MTKLFQYNGISINIRWLFVMFKIFLNHLVRYISGTPNTIAYCPKMSSPILFSNMRKLFLNTSRCSPFQSLHNITYTFARRVFNMEMDEIRTYYARQNTNIFCFTNLFYQGSTSDFNFAIQNLKTVFCNPNYMTSNTRNSMTTIPLLILHPTNIQKCVATESLALKRIVSTNKLKQ